MFQVSTLSLSHSLIYLFICQFSLSIPLLFYHVEPLCLCSLHKIQPVRILGSHIHHPISHLALLFLLTLLASSLLDNWNFQNDKVVVHQICVSTFSTHTLIRHNIKTTDCCSKCCYHLAIIQRPSGNPFVLVILWDVLQTIKLTQTLLYSK